jgi:PiT family inorganic phosphate transporter
MGIIMAVMIADGMLAKGQSAPAWVPVASYGCMALGTAMGGWRIVKTMGSKLTHLKPIGGFAAEIAGFFTLAGTAFFKVPVSTTHTITGAIVGVGSTNRARGVRWGLASRIVWAWVFTIPASAGVGALCYYAVERLGLW